MLRFNTIRVTKINQTTYGFNLDMDLYNPIDEHSLLEVDSFHNRSIDQPYAKSIFHWDRMSFPDRFKSCYVLSKSIIDQFQAHSNFPPWKSHHSKGSLLGEKFCF